MEDIKNKPLKNKKHYLKIKLKFLLFLLEIYKKQRPSLWFISHIIIYPLRELLTISTSQTFKQYISIIVNNKHRKQKKRNERPYCSIFTKLDCCQPLQIIFILIREFIF